MFLSAFCIIPETISPFLWLYSSNIKSLSTSLNFCTITCFAVCAAILPKSFGTISISTVSPYVKFLFILCASSKLISVTSSFAFSTISFTE